MDKSSFVSLFNEGADRLSVCGNEVFPEQDVLFSFATENASSTEAVCYFERKVSFKTCGEARVRWKKCGNIIGSGYVACSPVGVYVFEVHGVLKKQVVVYNSEFEEELRVETRLGVYKQRLDIFCNGKKWAWAEFKPTCKKTQLHLSSGGEFLIRPHRLNKHLLFCINLLTFFILSPVLWKKFPDPVLVEDERKSRDMTGDDIRKCFLLQIILRFVVFNEANNGPP